MKVKLMLDRSAIQEFFLQHVEKIVFAGVAVCFVAIVYGATTREMFPVMPNTDREKATPDKLAALAADAELSWEKTVPNPADYGTIDFRQKVGLDRKKMEEGPYRTKKVWNDFVVDQPGGAGVPRLYPVKELRGTADRGLISMVRRAEDAAAPAGPDGIPLQPHLPAGTMPQGQRWVVLTGLVPIEEQFLEYFECFKSVRAQGLNFVPAYVGYIVRRAEVSNPDAGEPLEWSETFYSGSSRKKAERDWGSSNVMAQEVVDPKYLDRDKKLSFPLAPLVGRSWHEEDSVVHAPEIPRLRRGEMYGVGETATDDVPSDDSPFDDFGSTGPYHDARGHGYILEESGYDGRMEGPSMPGQTRGRTSYYLFRFFDFNVEPGKRYRYQVRLVLWNPALGREGAMLAAKLRLGLPVNPGPGVQDHYLNEDVLARKKQILSQARKELAEKKVREARATLRQWLNIESDWSDPTDLISVPRDSRLLAVSVQPPSRVADQPRGSVMVVSWVKDQGIEAFREESVQRGKVANFLNCVFPETKKPRPQKSPGRTPGRSHGTGMEEMLSQLPSGSLEPADTSSPVDYVTDTLVLDMHGGERLPGKDRLNRPGAILVMGPDETLVVRHELDDLAECTEIRESLIPKQPGFEYDYPGYEMDGMNYDGYQPHGFQGLRDRGGPSRLPPRGGRGP